MIDQLIQSLSDTWRIAMIAVTVLGFLLHNTGTPERALATSRTVTAAGTVLGVAVLGLVAARLFGWELPAIATDRDATIAVVVLIAVKFALARVLLPAVRTQVAR